VGCLMAGVLPDGVSPEEINFAEPVN